MSIKKYKKKYGGGISSCKLSKFLLRYPDDKTQYNEEKLEDARKMIFETEFKVKKNSISNNLILIKNLVINLYRKAVSTS